MSNLWKLALQAIGVFAITIGILFWLLLGGPFPWPKFEARAVKPSPDVPPFERVETRLNEPEYLREDKPKPKGDDDPRRSKYRTALEEAIEAVERDHCALQRRKLLAVTVTAYAKAREDDRPCTFCLSSKSEAEFNRAWETPLDKSLRQRLGLLMQQGRLTQEDFKVPPALLGLRSRDDFRDDC